LLNEVEKVNSIARVIELMKPTISFDLTNLDRPMGNSNLARVAQLPKGIEQSVLLGVKFRRIFERWDCKTFF